jgi:hypothetical protein
MRGRRDLTQHFVISAFLTGQFGSYVADAAGVAKELADLEGRSGFSFADLAADQAGIRFARHVLSQHVTLAELAERFSVSDYLPTVDDLPEGLDREMFQQQYGDPSGAPYQGIVAQIRERIEALPPYHMMNHSE